MDTPVTTDQFAKHGTGLFHDPASTTAQGILELILAEYRDAVAIRYRGGESPAG